VVFVTLALIWTVHFFYNGLTGKPGPKLSPRLRTFHRLLHKTILVGLFLLFGLMVTAIGICLIAILRAWQGATVHYPLCMRLIKPPAR